MLLDFIENAKRELLINGIKPVWIKMSPNIHEMLADELNKMKGRTRQGTRIFEISGLKVEIDNECPPWTAYLEGEERRQT
jgi:hypothetical protein